MGELLWKEEVFSIIGAAMEVHSAFGPGFLEAVYHEAMGIELMARDIPHESQKPLAVWYKEEDRGGQAPFNEGLTVAERGTGNFADCAK